MTTTPRRGGIVIILTIITAMLLTVLPLPEWARPFRPPWYSLVLIYWCMATPQRVGVGTGWVLGVIMDVLTNTLLGQHALGLAVVAFISVKLHRRTRLFPLWQQALGVLLLLLLEQLLAVMVMGAIHRPAATLVDWAPPFVGMLLWPWIYIILRDLRRRFKVS
ncbi:Rod shape-determining protein MreD [hydrothermal vent metagenome]|uniref:Rod shape-determining protein MreD n=1 Tax=hydrothermal vent metagenome TaxID=652676 RepID=A0A3B1BHA1_9ZZZZ